MGLTVKKVQSSQVYRVPRTALCSSPQLTSPAPAAAAAAAPAPAFLQRAVTMGGGGTTRGVRPRQRGSAGIQAAGFMQWAHVLGYCTEAICIKNAGKGALSRASNMAAQGGRRWCANFGPFPTFEHWRADVGRGLPAIWRRERDLLCRCFDWLNLGGFRHVRDGDGPFSPMERRGARLPPRRVSR
jgi:hypothetical protein